MRRLLLLLLVCSANALAQDQRDCINATAPDEIARCAHQDARRAEVRLTKGLAKMSAALAREERDYAMREPAQAPLQLAARFHAAQAEWLRQRERGCALVAGLTMLESPARGAPAALARIACEARMARARWRRWRRSSTCSAGPSLATQPRRVYGNAPSRRPAR